MGRQSERIRQQQLQLVYARETCQRQIFIEDLKEYRKRKFKHMFNSIVTEVGPKWYQALSVQQRLALDKLEISIYQDLLEGRPVRTSVVIHKLGLIPFPSYPELMSCITLGCDDPKEMLAQLYYTTYGIPINGKKLSYCLHARLILSAIFYLGLDNLILLLEQTFAPDRSIAKPEPKPRPPPQPKLPSPYLTKLVAALYIPNRRRRPPPLPLPDLAVLNDPYEEEPIVPKPPPPPPPPPPPKKRLPISYCEKLAGINPITAHVSPIELPVVKKAARTRNKSKTKLQNGVPKKKYGIGIGPPKKSTHRKKRVPPSTGLWNAQYTINGVYQIQGKTCFVLGNVSILPALGELIHGGHAYVGGQYFNIHCGFRGWPPEQTPEPCDCVKQWQDAVFRYIGDTKCDCGHHFDFNNQGTFSQEELPYFTKATRNAPSQFHYDTIFDTDVERLFIKKEFKRIWETESLLRTDEDTKRMEKKKKKKKADKEKEKEMMRESRRVLAESSQSKDEGSKGNKETKSVKNQIYAETSQTCLGASPKVTDYLKCALRLMRKVNIAARLPDLHLVPELIEWMRNRLHGRLPLAEKKEYLRKSTTYWNMFKTLADQSFGHVAPPKEPLYRRATTWKDKQMLNDDFRQYTERYKLQIFKSYAYVNNLFWRTMYQAEFPDKKFREIFFSYLFSRVDDLQLIHPYSTRETMERKTILMNNRYVCLPDGWEEKT